MTEGNDAKKLTNADEIQKKLDTTIEQAKMIHKKALELNNRAAEPDAREDEEAAGDLGIRLKVALTQLENIQRKALDALDRFI